MSSFGAGGGSSTGSAGAGKQIMEGLGIDKIIQGFGQQFQSGQQQGMGGAAVTPGRQAQLSPQQRLATVMQMYLQPSGTQ